MNLDHFTKLLVNGRATRDDARNALNAHGYTTTFLACTQRILDVMNTQAMQMHLKQFPNTALDISLREIFSQLLLRMAPLFHAHGKIEVGEEEFHTFYRQQLSASEKSRHLYGLNTFMYFAFLHAQFNSKEHKKTESPLYGLGYVCEHLSQNRRMLGASSAAPEDVLAVLLSFAPEFMRCDERWAFLKKAASAVGLNLFLHKNIYALRRALGGQLSETLPMSTQSPVIADFVKNLDSTSSSAPLAKAVVEGNAVTFEVDPDLATKLMQYQDLKTGKTGLDYAEHLFAFPTTANVIAGSLPWVEPWTWPGLAFASANTKASLFAWMLADHHHPEYAQRTAEAVQLPWDLLNDKSPAEWASINPDELIAHLEPLLQPLQPSVELPEFDW